MYTFIFAKAASIILKENRFIYLVQALQFFYWVNQFFTYIKKRLFRIYWKLEEEKKFLQVHLAHFFAAPNILSYYMLEHYFIIIIINLFYQKNT